MNKKTLILILSIAAVVASVAWLIVSPGLESALALIVAITATIAEQRYSIRIKQHQSISDSSTGIQAGRDVKIGHTGAGKHAK
jgi:hypothetical protein